MGDTHRTVCGVDRLTARAGSAKHVDTQIFLFDFHIDFFGFGQDRNRGGRGMNAPTAFGFRHALHAVHAAFKFQTGKYALAANGRDNLLIAADLAFRLADNLRFPAENIGIARIHAKQITGKQRRFITARAGSHFDNYV